MDIILNNKVKDIAKRELKKQTELSSNDYDEQLANVIAYSAVLEQFHQKYIEGRFDYTLVKIAFKDFVCELIKLSVILQKQQNQNIKITNTALATHDDSVYILETNNEKQKNIVKQTDLKSQIEKLIEDTQKRYSQRFGEFDSKKMTDTILQKEFNETTEYLKFLESVTNIKFSKTNNLMPLIEAVDSMAYEAIQLSAVILRAERFWQKYGNENKIFKPFYIVFDGIKSTQKLLKDENYYNKLKIDTQKLNQSIRQSESVDLICPFMTYKQDEIHGVFNGELKDFVALASQVFSNQELRMVFSNKGINNIEFAPFGIPFDLYGPSCSDCRQKLSKPEEQLLFTFGNVSKGKIPCEQQFSK